jgi:hypothetical protein
VFAQNDLPQGADLEPSLNFDQIDFDNFGLDLKDDSAVVPDSQQLLDLSRYYGDEEKQGEKKGVCGNQVAVGKAKKTRKRNIVDAQVIFQAIASG